MLRLKILLVLLALAAEVPLASATVTHAVGSCKPSLHSFTTIVGALGATPSPDVVEVCAGTYPEQVVITFPVTIEGISADNSAKAIIASPADGVVVNATNDYGQPVAAQVLVENAAGEVNLTNLAVQGTGGFPSSGVRFVGVFYRNSPGTMNHLSAYAQTSNGLGSAVWLEGGSANPAVTLENSTLETVDNSLIVAETNSSTSELTVTVKGNYLLQIPDTTYGIHLVGGATGSISGNLILGSAGTEGILISGGEASVANNTVVGPSGTGIDFEVDGISVTSNTIYNTGTGIFAVSAVAPVTGNYITLSGTAIDYACVAGNNVRSNSILDAIDGIYQVATTAVTNNTYYNVGTIRGGGC